MQYISMIIRKIHNDDARWYEISEGVWYKSFTSVLSMMPAAPFFIKWLKEHTKEESEQLLNDAGLKGSKVHHTIDVVLKGDKVSPEGWTQEQINGNVFEEKLANYLRKPFTKEEDKCMRGFFNFCKDYDFKLLQSEMTVWSDKIKCAGTLDAYAEISIPEDGKRLTGKNKDNKKVYTAVIDWKTGKGLYESHNRQVAGYFYALKEMIRKKLVKVKHPKKAVLVQLGVNKCGYKVVILEDVKKSYKRFLRVNDEWNDEHPNPSPGYEYEYMDIFALQVYCLQNL